MNFFEGTIQGDAFVGQTFKHKLDADSLALLKDYKDTGKEVILGVRPEHIRFGSEIGMKAEVIEHLGPTTLVHGHIDGHPVVAKVKGWVELAPDQEVRLDFDLHNACFFTKGKIKEECVRIRKEVK